MKLFAVFLGGSHPRASIEVHDMRFVIGETLEATYPELRAGWWGKPGSLHIDGYAELSEVDGWQVELLPGPSPEAPRRALWFVNLGGYAPGLFGEQHHYLFLAGTEKSDIWKRARSLAPNWSGRHKDNLFSVEDVIGVRELLSPDGWSLRLETPAAGRAPLRLVSDYIRL